MIKRQHAKIISKGLGEDEELLQERLDAIGLAEELPLPNMHEGLSVRLEKEGFVGRLVQEKFEKKTAHVLSYTEEEELVVKLFSEANEHEKELIAKYKNSLIDPYQDKLTAIHHASTSDGLLIIIPAHTTIEEPIRASTTYDGNGATHTLIIARRGGKATITRELQENRRVQGTGLVTEAVEIIVEEGANIHYNEAQRLHKKTNWYSQKKATVKPKARMNWYYHLQGGGLSKQDITTTLDGYEAHTTNLFTVQLNDEQQTDTNAQIYHKAANTTSGMYAKGVCSGKAKLLHRGLIDIGDEAKDAQGYQQEDILLADEAVADAIPKLEIKNNEVQCSHGATIGNISEEELHYLRSRGLTENLARRMIMDSFIKSITNYTNDEKWKKTILELLEEGEEDV